jgi:hypothetical protein
MDRGRSHFLVPLLPGPGHRLVGQSLPKQHNQIQSLLLYYRFYECLVLCTDVLYAVRRDLKRLRRDELNLELCTNEVESKARSFWLI